MSSDDLVTSSSTDDHSQPATASTTTANAPTMSREEMLAYISKLNAAMATKQQQASSPATDPRLSRVQPNTKE